MAESAPGATPPARLRVRPGPPLQGAFFPPGDKSITHRAYLLALLAAGRCIVERPNPGLDGESTLACIAALGARVERSTGADDATGGPIERVEIEGRGFDLAEPEGVLDCGNSGTTLRLLAGVAAAEPFLTVLAGDASLHRRPVDRVVEPLRAMGATLTAREGDRLPPLVVRGRTLRGIDYPLPVASAQVASCVLLAGLQAQGETSITVPGPARDHTERLLEALEAPIRVEALASGGRRVRIRGARPLPAFSLRVPGDPSAAAFFLAAAAATPGARVTARGVSLNPTRTGLLDALEAMGAAVERRPTGTQGGEPVGDVTVAGGALAAFEVPAGWLPRMIDEVPAWAVAAARARGTSRLGGAGELRVKESDRLAGLARNLTRLGIEARESAAGLEIVGGDPRGGRVSAAGDHRMAMAFAVLGTFAAGPVEIEEAGGIPTSFPGFPAALAALGGRPDPAAEDGA